MSTIKTHKGFTLIELAIVLFIIALLLGGLLVPLATQYDMRQRAQALEQLDEIKEALIGFAIIHGRLPCQSSETDSSSPEYGMEDDDCSSPAGQGYLPGKQLGVAELDPWGELWRYRADSEFACPAGLAPCSDGIFILSTTIGDDLSVQDSSDPPNDLVSASERPVAIIFSVGANRTPDGANEPFDNTYQGGGSTSDFDDITIWITRPLLFNRMVTAGRLP